MKVKDYMNLPYTIKLKLIEDESGKYYFASVEELDGCWSDGETQEKALEHLKEAMELWLEVAIEHDNNIPLPKIESEYSGKFVVRIPKALHRTLAQKADEEGVSLNQYALYKLST